jgi:hypothetical protein
MKNQRKWAVAVLALVVGGIAWGMRGHDAAEANTETATPVRLPSARVHNATPSPPAISQQETNAQDAAENDPPAAPAPDNAEPAVEATPAAPAPSTSTTAIAGSLSFGGGKVQGLDPRLGYGYAAPFRRGSNRPGGSWPAPAPFRGGSRPAPAPFRGGFRPAPAPFRGGFRPAPAPFRGGVVRSFSGGRHR